MKILFHKHHKSRNIEMNPFLDTTQLTVICTFLGKVSPCFTRNTHTYDIVQTRTATIRTIEGGRGSEQRDLPQSPGQPQPPERFRLSIALVLKQPVCRFVGLQR